LTFIPVCAAAVVGIATPAAASPSPPTAVTQTASSGGVTATFTFTRGAQGTYPSKVLTISRGGRVAYHRPVTSRRCGPQASTQKYCAPGLGRTSVHVLDLEHNGRPDVVLDLYTGGAHCCSVEQVFSLNPATGAYARVERNFGDPGERIADLGHNGRHEFLTADDAFAYRFTDFAASGLPIEILTFAHRHFTNVTRRYPNLIAKDAATYLKAFNRDHSDDEGLFAAWAADEDNLGHQALVAQTLARELTAGNLRGGFQSAKKFAAALPRFLRKEGYVH
jgi:hypothetical protein